MERCCGLTRLEAADLLSQLPLQWQGQLTPLSGGSTNRSWQLITDSGRYWLRLGCETPERLGINRYQELRAHHAAAQIDLAPAIHFAKPQQGILIVDWLNEPDWSHTPRDLVRLIPRLVQLHQLQPPWTRFDFGAHAQHYLKQLDPLSGELKKFARYFRRSALNLAFPGVLCHQDLNVSNLMGTRPWLIDWEYAALSDVAFELAVLADSLGLEEAQARALVVNYQEAGGEMSWSRFQGRRPWVYWLTALWAALQYAERTQSSYLTLQETALAQLERSLLTL